jgi:hypothetical protein
MNERVKSITLHIAIAAAASLVIIWGNTQYRQWDQYRRGEDAMAKGDVIAAISGYEAAIHMYTPLSPLVSRSSGRLWQLAQSLEQKGDYPRALVAYRSLRSSYYAVRSLYSPGLDWISRCDSRIEALVTATNIRQAQQH